MEPNSDIVFDCSGLQYVASSGLRVILKAQKIVSMQGGKLKLVSVKPAVKNVFDMTGFTKFLHIECSE
jgi:anti-anti-sigma factor